MAMYYANSSFSVKEQVFEECEDCGTKFNVSTGHACIMVKKR